MRGLKHALIVRPIDFDSRTPPGVRGLKQYYRLEPALIFGRTPPGVRGLKLLMRVLEAQQQKSHPARGAWIETSIAMDVLLRNVVAPRPGCVD